MSQQDQKSAEAAQNAHILVVDDELFIRNALELYFETHGFGVSTASSGDLALEMVAKREVVPDLVLLDLLMPGTPGMDVLVRLKEIDPTIEVIIATGCGGMNTAVEALKHGAFDYITKPILDFDRDLLMTVEKALEARRFRLESEPRGGLDDDGADADEVQFTELENDHAHWLPVYESMNRLVSTYGGSPLDEVGLRAVWELLHEDFGADAALVIEQDDHHEWTYRQSWGFLSPPRPRDLWQSNEADSTHRGSGESPLRLWDLSVQPISTHFARKWWKVLQVPFHGKHEEPLLLLLFYRNSHPIATQGSPIPTLAATLSWLFCTMDAQDSRSFSTSEFDANRPSRSEETPESRPLEQAETGQG